MQNLRRTMLYVPGNNPGMIRDVHIYGSDSIMIDLEDSVSVHEKDAARLLVYHSLKTLDYGNTEVLVRVNALNTPYGRKDFEAMVRAKPDAIRLPKTETAEDVLEADQLISKIEQEIGMEQGTIKLFAAVESAKGVLNAQQIATASDRLIGIAIGAEDFVTDLKTTRSLEGIELLTARSLVLFAARAAGIAAVDTVFSDVEDEEGFTNEVKLIKQLGFDGKSIINPRQIDIVHKVYTPTEEEIRKSLRIIEAIKEAEEKGSGVISVGGKMVDKPIVERARRVLDLADASKCGTRWM
ncbi:citrate lyase, beta subunit [Desulfosporosinus orientis DSM 765]|uniref:Citrate lyase subunit beta n=1 Tax=Desulfosporosinus orientis (strain ATCC 19365 / DSM 765 / NCIMB 8382 / VKM B-1628 / Singapore I) TaxID=768706 RepID=G7W720_DESOD|nr:citrate (pro-3S)-lyase subunit beta [Desulfosporosinus orientis]AET69877.1 citrate lyase, beta subunit [Desulfosporosinus orientis DSM 765]